MRKRMVDKFVFGGRTDRRVLSAPVRPRSPRPDGGRSGRALPLAGNPWAERIQKEGALRVGFDLFRPWAMQTGDGRDLGRRSRWPRPWPPTWA